MSAMVHLNINGDHVAITEHNYDLKGGTRVVTVYLKRMNGTFQLWCDTDYSVNCTHVRYALSLPDVQNVYEIVLKKKPDTNEYSPKDEVEK